MVTLFASNGSASDVITPVEIGPNDPGVIINWKCPKDLVFPKELPKNTMGKVLKEKVKKFFER